MKLKCCLCSSKLSLTKFGHAAAAQQKVTRILVCSVLCVECEHDKCLQDNANNVLGIDPDVRELVYTQAVANGGAASYDIMRQLYLDVSQKDAWQMLAASCLLLVSFTSLRWIVEKTMCVSKQHASAAQTALLD